MADRPGVSTPAATAEYDREHVIALAKTLRALRERKVVQYRDMLDHLGLAEPKLEGKDADEAEKEKHLALARIQQRFSRWMQDPETGENWRILKADEYIKILEFVHRLSTLPIVDNTKKLCRESMSIDPVYYNVANWLNMSADDYRDLEKFCGHYRIYRHSLLNLNRVFVGYLEIKFDEATRSFNVTEQYKTKIDDPEPHSSTLKGFLYKTKKSYLILSIDQGSKELQYIHIDNRISQNEDGTEATMMYGSVADLEGILGYYSTRIGFIRYPENEINAQGLPNEVKLETIDAREIPGALAMRLNKAVELKGDGQYVALFA